MCDLDRLDKNKGLSGRRSSRRHRTQCCGTVTRHIQEGDEVYSLILTYEEKSGDKVVRKRGH